MCTMKDCCPKLSKGEGGLFLYRVKTGCGPDTRPYCKFSNQSHDYKKHRDTKGEGDKLLLCFLWMETSLTVKLQELEH